MRKTIKGKELFSYNLQTNLQTRKTDQENGMEVFLQFLLQKFEVNLSVSA